MQLPFSQFFIQHSSYTLIWIQPTRHTACLQQRDQNSKFELKSYLWNMPTKYTCFLDFRHFCQSTKNGQFSFIKNFSQQFQDKSLRGIKLRIPSLQISLKIQPGISFTEECKQNAWINKFVFYKINNKKISSKEKYL